MRRARTGGFTLIEVLVAITILALLMVALTLIPSLQQGSQNSRRTYATNAARDVIEAYRSSWSFKSGFEAGLPPGNLPASLQYNCTLQPAQLLAFQLVKNAATNTYDLTPTTDVPDLRRITVTVRCPQQTDVTLSTDIGHPQPELR